MSKFPIKIADSSVLLYDYQLLKCIDADTSLIIPFSVLDELRHKRGAKGNAGRNAREFFSLFSEQREKGIVSTSLNTPIVIWRESTKRIGDISKDFTDRGSDTSVIVTALELKEQGENPIILTRDSIVMMMADAFSVEAVHHKAQKFSAEELYPGYRKLTVSVEAIDTVRAREQLVLDELFYPNEYIHLVDETGSETSYCRYDERKKALVPLDIASSQVPRWISPRNIEQSFALDALLNDDIKLVSLIGKAGTGKTLLALAAGLYKSLDCDMFERVLVSRPTLPLGQDIGYLPGSVEEKLGPWMHPIADNIDFILKRKKSGRPNMRSFADLNDMEMVVIEPLTYIRGRSIHDQFLLVDEAQNLSLHEIRTILTRAGEGTKIILAGDPYQIDNPELTSRTSGLMQVVDRFCDESIAAHITLTKGERSELSELAADLL